MFASRSSKEEDVQQAVLLLTAYGLDGSGSGTFMRNIANTIKCTTDYDVVVASATSDASRLLDSRIAHHQWRVSIPPMYATAYSQVRQSLLAHGKQSLCCMVRELEAQIIELVAMYKPQGVIVNHLSLVAAAAGHVLQGSGVNVVVISHGTDLTLVQQNSSGDHRRILQWATAQASSLVFFTQVMQDRLHDHRIISRRALRRVESKFAIVRTGVDVDTFEKQHAPIASELDAWLGDHEFMLVVSQLKYEKGVERVVDMMLRYVCPNGHLWSGPALGPALQDQSAISGKRGIPRKLVVCGEGAQRQALERLVHLHGAQHSIYFAGHLSHAEIASLARRAVVGAYPSLEVEAAPLTPLELGLLGLPVLMMNHSGLSEIGKTLESHGLGEARLLLVDYHASHEKLLHAFENLIEHARRHSTFRTRLTETIRHTYQIKQTALSLLDLAVGSREREAVPIA